MAEKKKTVDQVIKDLVKENLDQAIVIKAKDSQVIALIAEKENLISANIAKDSQVIALIAEKENLISANKDLLEVAKKQSDDLVQDHHDQLADLIKEKDDLIRANNDLTEANRNLTTKNGLLAMRCNRYAEILNKHGLYPPRHAEGEGEEDTCVPVGKPRFVYSVCEIGKHFMEDRFVSMIRDIIQQDIKRGVTIVVGFSGREYYKVKDVEGLFDRTSPALCLMYYQYAILHLDRPDWKHPCSKLEKVRKDFMIAVLERIHDGLNDGAYSIRVCQFSDRYLLVNEWNHLMIKITNAFATAYTFYLRMSNTLMRERINKDCGRCDIIGDFTKTEFKKPAPVDDGCPFAK